MPKPITVKRPLIVNNVHMGELTVTPDPSYEISEIWRDTVDLLALVLVFFVLVNLMVYWAVGRALRPVDRILIALNELEQGKLDSRLPPFHLPELDRISEKFNGMAHTLQQSISRNHKLSQQLIHLQEEERKSLARDLHDELGQCLTAIRTDAEVILEMSKVKFPSARESAQAIVDVTLHVMGMVSAMLQRLRPEVLDALGLQPALMDLISTWRQRNQLAGCVVKISSDLDLLDETTSITAYRIVQEALTNVARHAKARRLEIEVVKTSNSKGEHLLKIVINDDGVGFHPEHADGFGLSGMQERVEGIGGHFSLVTAPGIGVKITVELPFKIKEKA
jgi:two-component system sensor histidine kinase UhpB